MRNVALAFSLLLAACAAGQPVASEPAGTCNAAGTDRFIGQEASDETGAAILRATNSRALRWAPPGVMLTMDFSPSRVTVRLGQDHKLTAINCG
jgi:hypothetical protein